MDYYYRYYTNDLKKNLKKLKKNGNSLMASLDSKYNEVATRRHEDFDSNFFDNYFSMIRCLKDLRRWNRLNRTNESSVLSHTFLVAFFALLFSLMHKKDIAKEHEQIGRDEGTHFTRIAILKALFHDVPESLTGDIISPVKNDMIKTIKKEQWEQVENSLCRESIKDLTKELPGVWSDINKYGLLEDPKDEVPFSISSMIKDCDRLALLIECLFEKRAGMRSEEMEVAYNNYLNELQNSEWHHIREFCMRLCLDNV